MANWYTFGDGATTKADAMSDREALDHLYAALEDELLLPDRGGWGCPCGDPDCAVGPGCTREVEPDYEEEA